MLWTLASALFLIGQVAGQSCIGTGKLQSGSNNYIIDTFSGTLLFSYAINQCTGSALSGTGTSYKYTCTKDDDDMWWVTKTGYDNTGCTGSGTFVKKWNESSSTAGELGYFKCDGKNNYAKISIGLDDQCSVTTSIAGGLGGCAANPSQGFDTNFYCDEDMTVVYLYADPTAANQSFPMCYLNVLCDQWNFGADCAFSTTFLGFDVYGKAITCATGEDGNDMTTTTEKSDDSSASSQTLIGVAIALLLSLFH